MSTIPSMFLLVIHFNVFIQKRLAFYISSRMFLYYHAYAYNHANLTATDERMRIWFPLIWFFEGGSPGKVIFLIKRLKASHLGEKRV